MNERNVTASQACALLMLTSDKYEDVISAARQVFVGCRKAEGVLSYIPRSFQKKNQRFRRPLNSGPQRVLMFGKILF